MALGTVPTAARSVPAALAPFQEWDGTTYYGREQLKPAPFEPWVVGGYIFLAGLSGSASILATLADATGRTELRGMVRRGRYLALLAPTIGSALLVYDLHTPKRFYNMLRVAKSTSPMSIGTWILMSFSGFAGAAALGQVAADRWPAQKWLRRSATIAGVPAALAGAGLSTYTASLLSATSTPIWAAAPRSLAVRFGSSSVATGAAALALGEDNPHVRAKLDAIEAAALAIEAVAASTVKGTYRRKGVDGAMDSPAGRIETDRRDGARRRPATRTVGRLGALRPAASRRVDRGVPGDAGRQCRSANLDAQPRTCLRIASGCLVPFLHARELARPDVNIVRGRSIASRRWMFDNDRLRPATPRSEPGDPAGPGRSSWHRRPGCPLP